ncbi:MAG: LOW QUALITY PROTEIN: glycosyltransferase family 39 protein [Linnemannia gamsii]|nr:MAG: LOW QUALITY PROTEIN: glycosyltransferase family 39 protein [Linnemannia gamsii]
MDVHPPLAKMLIALTGWIFGLDPSFDFKDIGLDYLAPKVPYVAMRMMCGLMGVAVVPMAFYTIKNSGHSLHASILAAVLVLFENSIVTQSRLILLDSPLIFFTAFTVLAWTNFHNQRKDPFSDDWFLWLFLTGLGLGLSGSVKWVGLFIIATVGTSTINQLWVLWGDLKITPRIWLNHFLARAICLIAVPLVVYMFMFEIHFLLLGNSGDGDGFMSAPFQMTLGRSLQDSPLGVAYGATISIRHLGTQGGYLHSHPSNYETGSKQQQITLYPHKDTNNEWIVQKRDGSVPDTLEYIKSGDVIRLKHALTSKQLHSHDNKPPMTEDENHFEVSGYGGEGFPGDSNDEWKLEILDYDGKDKAAGQNLHTLRSVFKLSHPNQACDLFSHKVKLPKWGFEQQEVTCMRSAVRAKVTWMVESNAYSSYPANTPMVNYRKPGFLSKFLELNKVMWTTNAGLTDSHPYDSRPSSWMWLRRGISFWGKEQKHIYLIGNWFTWYLSSFSVVLYATLRILLVIRDKRGYRDNFRGLREYYELSGGFFFMAWCYHYLPFFLMGRQLFLHHYLPALYFAILLLCVTFDLACRFIPIRFRFAALIVVSMMAILVFRTRAPLAFGSEWTRSQCEASKTWDYDCFQYPDSYASYKVAQAQPDSHMIGRIVDPNPPPPGAAAVDNPANDKPHDFLEHMFPHAPSPTTAAAAAAAGDSRPDSGMENIQLGSHANTDKKDPHAETVAAVLPTKQDAPPPPAGAGAGAKAPYSPGEMGGIAYAAVAAGAKHAAAPPAALRHSPIVEEHIGEGGDERDENEAVVVAEDVEDEQEYDQEEEEEGVLQEGDEGFNEPGAEEKAEAEAAEDEFIDTSLPAAADAAADKHDDGDAAAAAAKRVAAAAKVDADERIHGGL